MPLRGDEVLIERVRGDEWCVKFSALAIRDRIWEFEAHRSSEQAVQSANLFWSEECRNFVGNSRRDVPPEVLERLVDWIRWIASDPT